MTFAHWEDGSTNRTRTINLSSDTTVIAHYNIDNSLRDFTPITYYVGTEAGEQNNNDDNPPPALKVQAVPLDGDDGGGKALHMWAVIDPDESSPPGKSYTVYVHDYWGYTFAHWEDGNTDRARTLTISENTTMTAYYKIPSINYYPNFGSAEGLLQLNGDAAQSGDVLRLAPNELFKAGSAWFATKQHVRDGFETTFQFRIHNNNNNDMSGAAADAVTADGFAFVIQNHDLAALGGTGGGLGYSAGPGMDVDSGEGIPNSLAVEFDAFYNREFGDPVSNGNHVSIQTLGGNEKNNGSKEYSLGLTPPLDFAIADGNIHTAKIVYVPGTMKIFLDNLEAPVLESQVNLESTLNLDQGKTAFVGFTSATGAVNANNDILSWSFTPTTMMMATTQ